MTIKTIKFNNLWDDYGEVDEFEIIAFYIPDGIEINIQDETNILNRCYEMLNDEEYEENGIEEGDIDMTIAKKVLDDGDSGLIPDRIADFIAEKYNGVMWEYLKFDEVIDIH